MKLLFITQKLHGQDAFGVLWIDAFRKDGYEVEALCLDWQPQEVSKVLGRSVAFPVYSLGKEKGSSKLRQILTFWRLITSLKYDRVFIHMTPVWGFFGAPVWIIRRTPVYLWYTHYKMQIGLRVLGWYAKRMFCATSQSLPQYEGHPKKVVVGHGIDLSFWPQRDNQTKDDTKLLVVHRLSRSKRLELVMRAMLLLPEFTLDIYGIEAEPEYVSELKALVLDLELSSRVTFHGTVPAKDLASLYISHRLILNMASETIDKTMLEVLTCGCYPVTTAANTKAIGIPSAPTSDTPEAIADFVRAHHQKAPIEVGEMYRIVESRHSLDALIAKMGHYIRSGT